MSVGPISGFLSRFKPLTNITPFTYRDGATYLQILERLRELVNEVVVKTNEVIQTVNEAVAELAGTRQWVEERLAAYTVEQDRKFDLLRQELIQLIEDSTAAGVIVNPTNGLTEPVEKVVSDVFDNVRVHARFAVDMDIRDLTVAQLEAEGFTARHLDLSPLDDTNDALIKN